MPKFATFNGIEITPPNQFGKIVIELKNDNFDVIKIINRALLGKIREAVAKHITHNQIN